MGVEIRPEQITQADPALFGRRLEECVAALRVLLARPGFGVGPASLGAEIEASLVAADGTALHRNVEATAGSDDDRLTIELQRFNVEANLRPTPIAGASLSALEGELRSALAALEAAAATQNGRVATVGILPTLRARDVTAEAMTDSIRFRMLAAGIRERRGEPFHVVINGDDELRLDPDSLGLEGANTSFQLHLRVDPDRFRDTYNAAQLATMAVLAVVGNSPTFLGRRLWEETRIALVKQATDDRDAARRTRHADPRVSFGQGWLEGDAADLFAECVRLHAPALPVPATEEPLQAVADGGVPSLDELRLHIGTVWRWNRPVYDPAGGGHLRIELRALPSGPTVTDMVANAAFLLGLTLAVAPEAPATVEALPFAHVHTGFYAAARAGLDAELPWPGRARAAARELLPELLSLARRGLASAGVDESDATRTLAVIEGRIATGQTGARWQRRTLDALEPAHGREQALRRMLLIYLDLAAAGAPVHEWPVPAGAAAR